MFRTIDTLLVMLILHRAHSSLLMYVWQPFKGNVLIHHREGHDLELVETKAAMERHGIDKIKGAISETYFSFVAVFKKDDISALHEEPV